MRLGVRESVGEMLKHFQIYLGGPEENGRRGETRQTLFLKMVRMKKFNNIFFGTSNVRH